MFQEIVNKEKKIAVVGLGYVGLPLALLFARKYRVVGFDINARRVEMLRRREDPSRELGPEAFENADIEFTSDIEVLRTASFYIVAVPTPVDEHKVPDLKPILGASNTIGKVLKKGDYVIYESTVYPGCTEEDCLPILETTSGLHLGADFRIGYSPERINPGDKSNTIDNILKIVSGSDAEALREISAVYGSVIRAGVYEAPSIKVAEAAKVIENSQRDLNISFMNELSIIFDRMGIQTREVIEAAATKWNFLKFYPGLVGGHCIGVDPYYLLHKSHELGYDPQVILSGRRVNDQMPEFIAKKLVQILIAKDKNPGNCKVLIMGITFKENVSDIRNSKVVDLYEELKAYSMQVDIADYMADPEEVEEEYGLHLRTEPGSGYDAIVVAVAHKRYREMGLAELTDMMKEHPILMDLKGIYSRQDHHLLHYWSL
ncbi:MAG: nucleotide sugar dehydrogenase [Saprospiraceae bacterium]|nr:nucleotide sugar dehydrogenase [Saprospiraceae bacterium]HMX88273.1 nucleotide sugar dehydrogenase [Saprospiraceae bacterium]HMZ40443.1 nucleotide sugar dehydrogenase [Saprospiraceae bacterium]HNA64087.1 nucleotide sugar dehydrogenase [Saprospiraceae bacterium]HNB31765.1 nucleotide sugar dehydrogenase [Saprospiraceae bacterium]